MVNYFEILGLPLTLDLSSEEVDEAWRSLTNAASDSAKESSSDQHEARAVLNDATRRLEHWLSLRSPRLTPDAAIEPGLMDLFSEIQPAIASTDDLVAQHRKATTALAKAVLTKDTIAAQLKIQDLLGAILKKKTALTDTFSELETRAESGDFSEAGSTLTQLKFLTRWEQQCQERLLALIST